MKNIIKPMLLFLLLSIPILWISCEKTESQTDTEIDQPGDPVVITTETYQQEVIDSSNKFAFDIFRSVLINEKDGKNIMISPFSITSALSMTLNGSEGATFDSIRKTLGLSDKTIDQINSTYLKLMTEMVPVDKRVTVEMANSVWVEKKLTVKESFITDLTTWFKAESRNIDVTDPEAVDIVNGWIAEKTHDKITDMLDELPPDLAMLLINAVYFNGKWRHKFEKSDTKEELFYVTPGNNKTAPMMHQTENLNFTTTNNISLVEIPYGQGNYTMIVALPSNSITIDDLADNLSAETWNNWTNDLANNTYTVELSIPRFKYKYKRELKYDLKSLGMGIAFSGSADFSNISDQGLAISKVLHETFIETNEEGTEAAAATVVGLRATSSWNSEPKPIIVKIDRPFLYFISEVSTGTILFMGRVNDPTLD